MLSSVFVQFYYRYYNWSFLFILTSHLLVRSAVSSYFTSLNADKIKPQAEKPRTMNNITNSDVVGKRLINSISGQNVEQIHFQRSSSQSANTKAYASRIIMTTVLTWTRGQYNLKLPPVRTPITLSIICNNVKLVMWPRQLLLIDYLCRISINV